MRRGTVHLLQHTDNGADCLCGRRSMLAIHPDLIGDYQPEEICDECLRLFMRIDRSASRA
jgi:hypothetical protein